MKGRSLKKGEKKTKRKESLRVWVGLSLSSSLVRVEGSTAWDPCDKPPACTSPSTISLSSTITGKTAHC